MDETVWLVLGLIVGFGLGVVLTILSVYFGIVKEEKNNVYSKRSYW
jgi:hypothetical protein